MRWWIIVAVFAAGIAFNVAAQTSLKLSATSNVWRTFLIWQVAGNLLGFFGVLTITFVFRYVPLHVAYPISVALAIIGVAVVSRVLFSEAIGMAQWAGTVLVIAGIFLIARY